MNIIKSIESAFKRKNEREWKHIYIFVDIHGTIFPSDYGKGKSFQYYHNAQEVLQILSNRRDVILGLYTSSHPADIAEYLDVFEEHDINFQLVGDNPLEKNTKYACFDKKPYFNVLIDDKAGFEPNKDWTSILGYLLQNPISL